MRVWIFRILSVGIFLLLALGIAPRLVDTCAYVRNMDATYDRTVKVKNQDMAVVQRVVLPGAPEACPQSDIKINSNENTIRIQRAIPGLDRCLDPVLIGIDTNGDSEAEVIDANDDGILDEAIPAPCNANTPLSMKLVALFAGSNPIYHGTELPQGMTLQADGQITYAPSRADEGSTFTPTFTIEGGTGELTLPIQVTRILHPAIVGIDTNGDGKAEIMDANGDGIFDTPLEVDCNHPVPYRFKLLAVDADQTPVFSGTSLPPGMELAADGTISYAPPCEETGPEYAPSFSVNGGASDIVPIRVVRLPWLSLDLDNDGVTEVRDHNGDGSFDFDLAIPCGEAAPVTYTLVAHDAGDAPSFSANGLEGWMTLAVGNQIQITPPCDCAAGQTFHPTFTVEGMGGVKSLPTTLPVPVYTERYHFPAAAPWYKCPSDPIAPEATTVTALDKVWHYFGPEDRRTINQEVDFPPASPWSQVGLYLDVSCPESGKCDIWDRLATLRLVLNPEDPPEKWTFVEIARYATAYKLPMCQYIDITPLAPLLSGRRLLQSFIDTWVGPGNASGEGWRVTAKFVFYPGPGRSPDDIVGIYDFRNITVGQMAPGQTVDDQTPPITVNIPADAWRVETHFITTGHSFKNTKNCAEFCQMRQDLYVNGTINSVYPWRRDCAQNPVRPQPGTYTYSRNGWCPGSIVVGQVVDITDQLIKGGLNTLDFDIRLGDGSVYVNTKPDSWLPFETVTLRLYVYR